MTEILHDWEWEVEVDDDHELDGPAWAVADGNVVTIMAPGFRGATDDPDGCEGRD